jgi:hypothetical protein
MVDCHELTLNVLYLQSVNSEAVRRYVFTTIASHQNFNICFRWTSSVVYSSLRDVTMIDTVVLTVVRILIVSRQQVVGFVGDTTPD